MATYARIAARLRRIAVDLDVLAGQGFPEPVGVVLDIQPVHRVDGGGETRAVVDGLVWALCGQIATTGRTPCGGWHRGGVGTFDGVRVSVYADAPAPDGGDVPAVLERVRVALAETGRVETTTGPDTTSGVRS